MIMQSLATLNRAPASFKTFPPTYQPIQAPRQLLGDILLFCYIEDIRMSVSRVQESARSAPRGGGIGELRWAVHSNYLRPGVERQCRCRGSQLPEKPCSGLDAASGSQTAGSGCGWRSSNPPSAPTQSLSYAHCCSKPGVLNFLCDIDISACISSTHSLQLAA